MKEEAKKTQLEQPDMNKFHIEDLERKMARLEKSVSLLEILIGKFAERSGIKVEKFQNGLVIVSHII